MVGNWFGTPVKFMCDNGGERVCQEHASGNVREHSVAAREHVSRSYGTSRDKNDGRATRTVLKSGFGMGSQ